MNDILDSIEIGSNIEFTPYTVDIAAEVPQTATVERIIPTSQYGWGNDYVMPEEYDNFILTDSRIIIFNGNATYSQESDKLVVNGSGYYQMLTGYKGSWTGMKTTPGPGAFILSNVDITNNNIVVFQANYSFTGTTEPGEEPTPEPSQPGQEYPDIDVSGIITELQVIEQNQLNLINNSTQMYICVSIFLGILVGQIILLGFWRAKRRG